MAMNTLEKIDDRTFEDVIMYVFAEPGAMGMPAMIECMKRNGEIFAVSYANEKTNWDKIKECWTDFRPNKFNGPHIMTAFSTGCMVIGEDSDIRTTLDENYRELCFDVGNHFICKEEHFRALRDFFKGSEPYEIILYGFEKIIEEGFLDNLDEIEESYYKQEEADDHIAELISELSENPEYEECEKNRDIEGILNIFKEFSGIEMTPTEFKQYCMRRMGF